MIYLDNNATTKPTQAVAHAVAMGLTEFWANPSSVHRPGQAARQQIELARDALARLIRARPREITLLSGGTEALDLAIRGLLDAAPHPHATNAPPVLVTTRVEHAAIRELAEDLERRGVAQVRWASVDGAGRIDPAALAPLLPGARACAVQWANNETGVIQPVEAIATACAAARTPLVLDATQWVGKEPTDVRALGADALVFAPHKFHGPKGVGVLWTRAGLKLRPRLIGTQELGRRGGTENVPGIMGAGVAAREAEQWLADPAPRAALARLRDRFEQRVLEACPWAVANRPADPTHRLWNTCNIGFPRLEAEALLLMLSERGVCASAGAACSSGSLDPSPVLLAMGVPPQVAHGSLRFSLSRQSTAEEIDHAATIVADAANALRRTLGPVGAGPDA